MATSVTTESTTLESESSVAPDGIVTAADLLKLTEDGQRYELIEGEVRAMSPAGNKHGKIAMALGFRPAAFVQEHKLGAVCAAETGFLIQQDPDTVRDPDVTFVTQTRIDEVGPVDGYWTGDPDIVAEVVSPNDRFSDTEQKALSWLKAGSKIVWGVDPAQAHVTEYRGVSEILVLSSEENLTASQLLPGWEVTIAELFV
ncbi:MAG: Uma2 family endonuclease [Planctomycetaceae bacterium]|nr:Uma2 family endonuclease [Planctomycetaceae bacterium]